VRVSPPAVVAWFPAVGGFLAALRPGIGAAELQAAAALATPAPLELAAPWAPTSHLESVVWADLFPGVQLPLTRAEAIRVPAVARARHIICTTLARIELGSYRGVTRLTGAAEPSWLAAADGGLSPWHRMLYTVDDLLFYGWALWRVTERSATSDGGFPLRMARVPMGEWQLEDGTRRVLLRGADGQFTPAPLGSTVLIPGPHEGLLSEGAPAVRHAADLQRSAHNAAKFPHAYLGLKQTSGTPLKRRSDDATEVTVETVLADWRAARNNPEGGGVAWLGGVEPHEFGSYSEHMLTEGRNAAAVDIARHASIPSDLIDATVTESSLHYSTSRDNDRRAVDYGLGAYMGAISARLSMDDVTPRGQRIAFDLELWLKGAGPAPGEPAAGPAPGLATQPGARPTAEETPA
jgi:hypothetical protein